MSADLARRAEGAYLGLAVGDALGATVEFLTPREIRATFARDGGVHRQMIGGGWLRLKPGQVTDDTTMALALGDAILAREIGDRIRVIETEQAIDTEAHVDHIAHHLEAPGALTTTIYARKAVAEAADVFVLDVSTLDGGDRLWRNPTLSADSKWAFVTRVRTVDIVLDAILSGHKWAVDRSITKTYIKDVTDGLEAFMRDL